MGLTGPYEFDHRDLVDSTRARLRADGWRVSDVMLRNRVECSGCDESTLPQSAVFTAGRADSVVNVEISVGERRPLHRSSGWPRTTRRMPTWN